VHLVGFIIKKFVTVHGHMNVKANLESYIISRDRICTEFKTQEQSENRFIKRIDLFFILHSCNLHHIDFFLNNQPDALIIQIYSVIKLYMFRAPSVPIIRSFLLYIRHW